MVSVWMCLHRQPGCRWLFTSPCICLSAPCIRIYICKMDHSLVGKCCAVLCCAVLCWKTILQLYRGSDTQMMRSMLFSDHPHGCMQAQVEEPLVATGLAPKGFLNSYALNMYHDGSEGIQSHYDDADRFSRPIYSVRLFSDSRLSFGTQLYGYTNGAFCVDMPR